MSGALNEARVTWCTEISLAILVDDISVYHVVSPRVLMLILPRNDEYFGRFTWENIDFRVIAVTRNVPRR